MMNNNPLRFVCIHGHFYQPPRENAWLETIDHQPSAAPFHDWNERINEECYKRNAWARIQDEFGNITDIVNNYEWISFNFGPTLLSWMETEAPETYARILEADQNSAERLNGHGNALAQVFSHLIMPLANERDKETQVIWGIRDFENRFNRKPEGMWLAESAVDVPTLEVLAKYDIKFTVLAPGQAAAVKEPGSEEWEDVSADSVDPTRPYKVVLPSGREIAVFFYNGQISQEVAFNGLLHNGRTFSDRILQGLPDDAAPNALMHIATDGETYGHHHSFGEMALAAAIHFLKREGRVELTNYAAYLDEFPPVWEAKIVEPSSWSCAHGVERWRSDCGCHTGGEPGWNQSWRGPLRDSLDFVRDTLAPFFEKEARCMVKDPWALRNDYIDWILEKDLKSWTQIEKAQQLVPLPDSGRTRLLQLLEMQRQCILMYTSCGWFFNEVSGIETLQILQYAYRAIRIAEDLGHKPLLESWKHKLQQIPSNIYENGLFLFEEKVESTSVDQEQFAAFIALMSLWKNLEQHEFTNGFALNLESLESKAFSDGRGRRGIMEIQNRISLEKHRYGFIVWVNDRFVPEGRLVKQPEADFLLEDWVAAHEINDLHFSGGATIDLHTLYHEHQLLISAAIFQKNKIQKLWAGKQVFEIFPFKDLPSKYGKEPLPIHLEEMAVDYVSVFLKDFFKKEKTNVEELATLAQFIKEWKVELKDYFVLNQQAGELLTFLAFQLDGSAEDVRQAETLLALDAMFEQLGLQPAYWELQNVLFAYKNVHFPHIKVKSLLSLSVEMFDRFGIA
jgi:alpha-amylase/alpha-mannosidase (GH57 family)